MQLSKTPSALPGPHPSEVEPSSCFRISLIFCNFPSSSLLRIARHTWRHHMTLQLSGTIEGSRNFKTELVAVTRLCEANAHWCREMDQAIAPWKPGSGSKIPCFLTRPEAALALASRQLFDSRTTRQVAFSSVRLVFDRRKTKIYVVTGTLLVT